MKVKRGSTYAALGSSYAAGPGLYPLAVPQSGRSSVNYPHLLAERLDLDLVDASSAGATTGHILDEEQVLFDGSRAAPQISLLTTDTALVTVTVGGNDVDYILSLLRCSARVDAAPVPEWMRDHLALPVDTELVSTGLAGLQARIGGVLAAITHAAPRARIMVVDYLTVIGAFDGDVSALPMSDVDRTWCADLGATLEALTAAAAREAGVELIGAAAASREHGVGSRQPWVGGWEFGDVLAGGAMAYHPTASGMRAVADLLVARLG